MTSLGCFIEHLRVWKNKLCGCPARSVKYVSAYRDVIRIVPDSVYDEVMESKNDVDFDTPFDELRIKVKSLASDQVILEFEILNEGDVVKPFGTKLLCADDIVNFKGINGSFRSTAHVGMGTEDFMRLMNGEEI